MTSERWARVKEIFFVAVECPSAEERTRLVVSLAAGDEPLQAEVLSLLEWAPPDDR